MILLPAFGSAEHGELGYRHRGIGDGGFQQDAIVAEHALNGCGVEVGVVFQATMN